MQFRYQFQTVEPTVTQGPTGYQLSDAVCFGGSPAVIKKNGEVPGCLFRAEMDIREVEVG
ncbi:hypothetical protein AQ916_23030 [Burkholderia pseudomallei]|nr:hypothetical protein AQ916_23030 [Burkholderia pseudomallei]